MQKSCLAALALLATVSWSALSSAQDSVGTLNGVITDAAGAPVAGAFVQMKNAERRLNFMVITQEQGKYSQATGFPRGKYVVQAIGGEHQSAASNRSRSRWQAIARRSVAHGGARTALPPAWPGRTPGERGAEAAAATLVPGRGWLKARAKPSSKRNA
jgi:hypothetical protein